MVACPRNHAELPSRLGGSRGFGERGLRASGAKPCARLMLATVRVRREMPTRPVGYKKLNCPDVKETKKSSSEDANWVLS